MTAMRIHAIGTFSQYLHRARSFLSPQCFQSNCGDSMLNYSFLRIAYYCPKFALSDKNNLADPTILHIDRIHICQSEFLDFHIYLLLHLCHEHLTLQVKVLVQVIVVSAKKRFPGMEYVWRYLIRNGPYKWDIFHLPSLDTPF